MSNGPGVHDRQQLALTSWNPAARQAGIWLTPVSGGDPSRISAVFQLRGMRNPLAIIPTIGTQFPAGIQSTGNLWCTPSLVPLELVLGNESSGFPGIGSNRTGTGNANADDQVELKINK